MQNLLSYSVQETLLYGPRYLVILFCCCCSFVRELSVNGKLIDTFWFAFSHEKSAGRRTVVSALLFNLNFI